jgi:hypothetical protein
MGLFWDLLQQSQIHTQSEKSANLESRVAFLEQELQRLQTNVHSLVILLEKHFGEDIDRDGRIG